MGLLTMSTISVSLFFSEDFELFLTIRLSFQLFKIKPPITEPAVIAAVNAIPNQNTNQSVSNFTLIGF